MSAEELLSELAKPNRLTDANAGDWFDRIAKLLLVDLRLLVAGQSHRLVEVEAYYHGPEHADPFAHCDPIQHHCGRWYFHRTRGTYRGGSFKGVDLAFGDAVAFGGFLIRGIETPTGDLVDGPSLTVDHLLKQTGAKTVAELDRQIAERPAWEKDSSLAFHVAASPLDFPIYRSARVGLSLKRVAEYPTMPQYLSRRYRWLTEPCRTKKGRSLLAKALQEDGKTAEEIRGLTRSRRSLQES